MLFENYLKISGVVIVFALGITNNGKVNGQTNERLSGEESQSVRSRKNLQEVAYDLTAKNRALPSKENSLEATDLVVSIDASGESANRAAYVPRSLPLQRSEKLSQLDKAYLDAFTILNDDNECSRLYGGRPAIMALNELVKDLKPTYLNRSTGVRMYGTTTTIQHNPTGFMFRVFEKAELNLGGAFYRSNFINEAHVPTIGIYQPNTREARVALLLHELGHLVRGTDKQWVLPDDGNDPEISRENTSRVINVCNKQIQALGKIDVSTELLKAGVNAEQPADATVDASPF